MIPEPIALYNSGLIVLSNASPFMIFLLNLEVFSDSPPPQARRLPLTAVSPFTVTVLASLAPAPNVTHYLYQSSAGVIPSAVSSFLSAKWA